MTQIKVIFIFAPMNSFGREDLERVRKIVGEEYARQFGCGSDAVSVTLCDGKAASDSCDIAISIAAEEKRLNEGAIRSLMKKEIANRLLLLFPRSSGFRGRIATMDAKFEKTAPAQNSAPAESGNRTENEDAPGEYKKRAAAYEAVDPVYTYDMLVIAPETKAAIERAVGRIQYEQKVFEDWGLYAIMPHPISAMSFFGPPGTGKTMAADAVANRLGKKIIHASYADIESKYHGEGPKNVSALFLAAQQQDAVLFIDEADSLLSKRLTNVTQGSEQAINSMRSQLLICLENFHGIVIFATNLVVNYDRAFISRLINVEFPFPDAAARETIWRNHLRPTPGAKTQLNIPLAKDVDEAALAAAFELCGREIRNCVVSACVQVCMEGFDRVDQAHLMKSAEDEISRREGVSNAEDHTKLQTSILRDALAGAVRSRLADAPAVSAEETQEKG